MNATAKLSDLIDALEFESPDYIIRYDRENGRVVMVDELSLRAVEEDDEKTLTYLAKWQNGQLDIARAIVADPADRFIHPPDRFQFHEYRHMEKFVRSLTDEDAAEQLWRAIKGKGAFRCFKDTLRRLDLRDQWNRYREQVMKEFVIDWAKANEVPYEDDLRERVRPGGHKKAPDR